MKLDALVIFIKNPRLGKVKTRLAATVGWSEALKIYQALLERTRQVALDADATRYLFYSDFLEEKDDWQAADFIKKVQRGKDLGERMANAFTEILQKHSKVVLIGSDTPALTGKIIQEAFEALETCEVTIGPCQDGGYYLIGMNVFLPELFENIEWGTPIVFYQTLKKLKALGMRPYRLPILSDIDREEDWLQHGWQI